MASFRYQCSGQAPLKVQLGAATGITGTVREVAFYGENTTGVGYEPTVYRPSTIGTGSNIFQQSLDLGVTASLPIIISFSGAPSAANTTPALPSLPGFVQIAFPSNAGLVVGYGGALVLYANATGGHTWAAELHWEEP